MVLLVSCFEGLEPLECDESLEIDFSSAHAFAGEWESESLTRFLSFDENGRIEASGSLSSDGRNRLTLRTFGCAGEPDVYPLVLDDANRVGDSGGCSAGSWVKLIEADVSETTIRLRYEKGSHYSESDPREQLIVMELHDESLLYWTTEPEESEPIRFFRERQTIPCESNHGFEARPSPIPDGPYSIIQSSDMDGDGREDLITLSVLDEPGETPTSAVSFWKNVGGGRFQSTPTHTTELDGVATSFTTGRLNKDKFTDVVVDIELPPEDGSEVGERRFVILTGSDDGYELAGEADGRLSEQSDAGGTESLEPSRNTLKLADLNGDRTWDLLYSDGSSETASFAWRLGDGRGQFSAQPEVHMAPFGIESIETVVFDLDWRSDVLIVGKRAMSVLVSGEDGSFESEMAKFPLPTASNEREQPQLMAGKITDLNGDGVLDLIGYGTWTPDVERDEPAATLWVWRGIAWGEFEAQPTRIGLREHRGTPVWMKKVELLNEQGKTKWSTAIISLLTGGEKGFYLDLMRSMDASNQITWASNQYFDWEVLGSFQEVDLNNDGTHELLMLTGEGDGGENKVQLLENCFSADD